MSIDNIIVLAQDSTLTGHAFILPVFWFGRQVQDLTESFTTEPHTWDRIIEISKRVSLLALLTLMVGFVAASFVVGLAVKQAALKYPPPPTTILDDVYALHGQMDDMLRDLTTLRGAKGRQFQAAVNQFEAKYNKETDSPTSFKDFEGLKILFTQLINLREGLFFIDTRVDDQNVMHQPKDGNCFFHAMGRALVFLRDQLHITDPLDHTSFRNQVVNWMRTHVSSDATLRQYISEAIEAFVAKRRAQYQDERLSEIAKRDLGIDVTEALRKLDVAESALPNFPTLDQYHNWYFEKMDTPGFFASNAERYAVSQMYQVSIAVRRRIGVRLIDGFDPVISPAAGGPLITLIHVDGDHFDLQII